MRSSPGRGSVPPTLRCRFVARPEGSTLERQPRTARHACSREERRLLRDFTPCPFGSLACRPTRLGRQARRRAEPVGRNPSRGASRSKPSTTGRPGTSCDPRALVLLGAVLLSPLVPSAPAQETSPKSRHDLTELTLEQLANVEVTSVSKKAEKRWRSPTAVSVITRDDIRRSGVTTLVDALRLVPGVQVARINSNKWAVGVRGFASNLARSLLVLIDGRSVYTPLFAGTYWEVQDTLLEDVDRIEVIRGPGGALWGANAVNGVINIITRSSLDTQGGLVTAGGGTEERGFVGVRYGGVVDKELHYRAYGKFFDRAPGFNATGDNYDAWHMGQAGFRTDWNPRSSDSLTFQGDAYTGKAGQRATITGLTPPFLSTVDGDTDLSGANALARWRHVSPTGAEWTLGSYFDRTDRHEITFREVRNTIDLDFQRRAPYGKHDVIFGLGYRASSGTFNGVPTIAFTPPRRGDQLFTGFIRDEVTLIGNKLAIGLGSKFEHNDYSDFEFQPSAQLLWTPTPTQSAWTSITRAVRTPSRIEQDLALTALVDPSTPTFARLIGDHQFQSEKILSVQVGYRVEPARHIAIDAVAFWNDHTDLLSLETGAPFAESSPSPHLVLPFFFRNGIEGQSYGLELAGDWTPFEWWHVTGSYSFLRLDLKSAPGSTDTTTAMTTNGSAPRHTVNLQSRMDLFTSATLDITGRYVGELPSQRISSYSSFDARLAWRPVPKAEISVVAQNLFCPHHAEFPGDGGAVIEVRRGIYGALTWRP